MCVVGHEPGLEHECGLYPDLGAQTYAGRLTARWEPPVCGSPSRHQGRWYYADTVPVVRNRRICFFLPYYKLLNLQYIIYSFVGCKYD